MKAIFKYAKTEIRTVYVGTYGGHYEAMFFFKSKPKKVDEMNDGTKYYCTVTNEDLVIGSMYRGDFEELYPDFDYSKIAPDNIEITRVFKIESEAVYDKYGGLVTFNYSAEN